MSNSGRPFVFAFTHEKMEPIQMKVKLAFEQVG